MSKRYDACAPRKGNDGKTRWQKVGVAFEGDRGIQILLDAYPIPDSDGRVAINLFEPKPREDAPRPRGQYAQSSADGDDIPGWD